jgi:hypothetical protein
MSNTTGRIYAVTNKENGSTRLVMAANAAQALRHVTQAGFTVKAANAVEVGRHMAGGIQLETAGESHVAQAQQD